MTNKSKVKLHFQRFEFKYVLDMDQYHSIKDFLSRYMVLDRFAEDTAGGFYDVVSLYYDSPMFFYYWAKMDGESRRKKIRLRTYRKNGLFADAAFLEIKRKHDSVILKDRFNLSESDKETMLERGHLSDEDDLSVHDQNVVDEYYFDKNSHVLSPKLLVTYSREPYLGKYNKNARITFDYSIRARQCDDLYYSGEEYTDVSGDKVVLEIKFNGNMPHYMAQIIKEYNLARVPYSKYCNGIEACYSLAMPQMFRAMDSQSDSLFLNKNRLIN